MSVDLYVDLLRSREDKRLDDYLEIFKKCRDMGIGYPPEVVAFFNEHLEDVCGHPDEYCDGSDCDPLAEHDPDKPDEIRDAYAKVDYSIVKKLQREWRGQFESGFEIDVADFPEGVKTIRVYLG